MFRDFDEFQRPFRPHTVNIPRRNGNARHAPMSWQQAYQEAQAKAAAWREEAQQYQTAVQQQAAELKKLRAQLAQEQAQTQTAVAELEAAKEAAAGWQEKFTRLQASMENDKKRLAQRYAGAAAQEQDQFLLEMLVVADNLERALVHAAGSEAAAGIQLTLKSFQTALAKYGVEPVPALGRPFDPNQHEAVSITRQPDQPAGTVAMVTRTGYTRHGRLLRPAQVVVAAEQTAVPA